MTPAGAAMARVIAKLADPHEMREAIFNAEMALIDLRGFSNGGSNPTTAAHRARELKAEAVKLEKMIVQGEEDEAA